MFEIQIKYLFESSFRNNLEIRHISSGSSPGGIRENLKKLQTEKMNFLNFTSIKYCYIKIIIHFVLVREN